MNAHAVVRLLQIGGGSAAASCLLVLFFGRHALARAWREYRKRRNR